MLELLNLCVFCTKILIKTLEIENYYLVERFLWALFCIGDSSSLIKIGEYSFSSRCPIICKSMEIPLMKGLTRTIAALKFQWWHLKPDGHRLRKQMQAFEDLTAVQDRISI